MGSAHQKGSVYENKIAKKLSQIFGITLKRVALSGALDQKGDLRPEVVNGKMAHIPWVIECKNQKQIKVELWLNQVEGEERISNTYEYEEDRSNYKAGILIYHIHGTYDDIVVMKKKYFEDRCYPPTVDDILVDHCEQSYKAPSKYGNLISDEKSLTKRERFIYLGDYVYMHIDTFAKLYRK
jgi:hypothetical protein